MKRTIGATICVFVVVFSLLVASDHYLGLDLSSLYERKFQTPLFTGFLTLGSFVLTLKTFILLKLKAELYDSAGYKERLALARSQQDGVGSLHYGPLRRLGDLLVLTVFMALSTSALQLSLGLIPRPAAAAACIAAGATTLFLVFFSWLKIRSNIHEWFDLEEAKSKKELEEQSTM